MNKGELISNVLTSKAGPIIAGIGAITILVGGYYVMQENYSITWKNGEKSLTFAPAAVN